MALAEWTGQRTVPNVFIGGKHIGGCDCKFLSVIEKIQPNQYVKKIPLCICTTNFPRFSLAAVMEKHNEGKLVPLLADAGAIAKLSVQS